MLLEKIKEHGGKITFFSINILLVAVGTLFIKQKNTQEAEMVTKEADVQNYKLATDYALEAQKRIAADKEEKINSIANNPDTVQSQDSLKTNALAGERSVSPAPVVVAPPKVEPAPQPSKVDGKCGSANSSAKRGNSKCDGKAPTTNLCSAGTASSIAYKPNKYDLGWRWTCAGKNGGASATCKCS